MLRTFLRYAAILMVAALVLSAAMYLDRNPLTPDTQKETQSRQETEAAVTMETAVQTETSSAPETQSAETLPPETQPPETEPTEPPTEPKDPNSFLLTFAGDCTLGSNPVNRYALYGFENTVGDDFRYPFANVIDYFDHDDFTMVNLEGTLGDSGVAVTKAHNFRGDAKYVNVLTQNSVEGVTLANNHTMDYGPKGYAATLQILNDAAVPYVETNSTHIFTTDRGLTIGVYATVYFDLDVEHMVSQIQVLKEQGADVIVVAAHWGAEGYYDPNNVQTDAGHAAIDAGAHIVYGAHPHVLQPIEEYNGGIIYYSLGNFSFGGNLYPDDYDTALIQQEIIRQEDGTVRLGKLTAVPCRVSSVADHNNFQPTPYPAGSPDYLRVMEKLGLPTG